MDMTVNGNLTGTIDDYCKNGCRVVQDGLRGLFIQGYVELFYIHGEYHKFLDRTCRLFDERCRHMLPMMKHKFPQVGK